MSKDPIADATVVEEPVEATTTGAVGAPGASSSPSAVERRVDRDLRRPFTAAAVRYKIQTNPKSQGGSALLVAYIDARLVSERLNAVVGMDWEDDYIAVQGGLLCALTVAGKTRRDVGWSPGTGASLALKTLYSDAFKRAAVKFGVGVSIYSLPKAYLSAPDIKLVGKNWYVQPSGEKRLAAGYDLWLKTVGVELFGEPFDHGDVLGSQGDVETTAPEGSIEPPAEPEFLETLRLAFAASRADRDWLREQLGVESVGEIAMAMQELTDDEAQALLAAIEAFDLDNALEASDG